MKNIIKLSLPEYAKLMGVKPQAIFYRIKHKMHLPGVRRKKQVMGRWQIFYDQNMIAEVGKLFFNQKHKS